MRRDRARALGVRWTIGDVSAAGFEVLRLSIWGAVKLFGGSASYAVCVNTISTTRARELVGDVPDAIEFRDATHAIPRFLGRYLGGDMAEGVAWKLAPLHVFHDRHELALDNDCVLWAMPRAIEAWLDEEPPRGLLAEDVRPCFGHFAELLGGAPRNSGIRGLPPRFDLQGHMERVLARVPRMLTSELDEQGLQVAAVSAHAPPHVVSLRDVSLCSPFPPHLPTLGQCGAHFVGLNVKRVAWELDGRPGHEHILDHWRTHRREVHARVGVAP